MQVDINFIMMNVVTYGTLTLDCRNAIEAKNVEELKKAQAKKTDKYNEIVSLIKLLLHQEVNRTLKEILDKA